MRRIQSQELEFGITSTTSSEVYSLAQNFHWRLESSDSNEARAFRNQLIDAFNARYGTEVDFEHHALIADDAIPPGEETIICSNQAANDAGLESEQVVTVSIELGEQNNGLRTNQVDNGGNTLYEGAMLKVKEPSSKGRNNERIEAIVAQSKDWMKILRDQEIQMFEEKLSGAIAK